MLRSPSVVDVQTLLGAALTAGIGAILAWMVHGLRRELASHRAEVSADIRSLRAELAAMGDRIDERSGGLRAEIREEFRGVRADMTQIALAVGARPGGENARLSPFGTPRTRPR